MARNSSCSFAMSTTSQDIRHKSNFIASVVDPKCYFLDPYPTFQLVSYPDPVLDLA